MPDTTHPDAAHDATDGLLAAQYEAYPYPKRDPRDEAKGVAHGRSPCRKASTSAFSCSLRRKMKC